jgi:hypothetical protein
MPTGEVSVEHEFVSAACVHRNHSQCQPGCVSPLGNPGAR